MSHSDSPLPQLVHVSVSWRIDAPCGTKKLKKKLLDTLIILCPQRYSPKPMIGIEVMVGLQGALVVSQGLSTAALAGQPSNPLAGGFASQATPGRLVFTLPNQVRLF